MKSILPRFAATIFLSAFLLFQVQPIIARFIVPWFGGSAAVWSTALLFFQVVLLLGYLYAHGSIRYGKPRLQANLHLGLLIASILSLPILPRPGKPLGTEEPVGAILLRLAATVGLPYLMLSTTGPLLQAWYARLSERSADGKRPRTLPYQLYALSNIGSMLGLLSYPVFVEPLLTIQQQAWVWSGAYLLFVILCGSLAWSLRGIEAQSNESPVSDEVPLENVGANSTDQKHSPPHAGQYILWTFLAACTSTLLIAVTNQITQNVAAVPFLWVLPLSLYLLSFIIVFGPAEWRWSRGFLPLPALAVTAMAYALSEGNENLDVLPLLSIWLAGLFICCILCHGELARLKPAPRYLTAFYLMMSLGGALGGIFVGLIAPRIFNAFYELPIAVGACAMVALLALYRERGNPIRDLSFVVTCALTGALIYYLGNQSRQAVRANRLTVRNFYGVLNVRDDANDDNITLRALYNGTIRHGSQYMSGEKRYKPTTYYRPESGVGRAVRIVQRQSAARIGVIGLGTGTVAAYGRPGDVIHYYEINPQVTDVAYTQFSYLKDCKAKIEIAPGDARLTLENEPVQNFDVLAVDAFSSDAIPTHLLTRAAFALYFHHLKPNGILAVHVSNRHIDLQPVVAQAAAYLNKKAILIYREDKDDDYNETASAWILVSSRPGLANDSFIRDAAQAPGTTTNFPLRPWTDDYSSLLPLLH